MQSKRFSAIFAVACFLVPLLSATPASAATIVVNTTADEFGTGAGCSLREAIESANTNTAFGGCSTPGNAFDDVVSIPPGTYQLTIPPVNVSNFDNAAGSLHLGHGIILDGTNDTDASAAVISAEGLGDRIITNFGSAMTIRDLTLTGGNAGESSSGGAIAAATGANVTLQRVVIRGNQGGLGGGIAISGTWTLDRVSIVENEAAIHGGGVVVFGTATFTNVTVSDNDAEMAAGGVYIFSSGATLTSTNSTIAENTSSDVPGQLRVASGATATLKNTIVSGSGTNCTGTVTSNGNNLDSGTTCGFNVTGDLQSTNPKLDELRDYGGGIPTRAIVPSSLARNAGSNTGAPVIDIRGAVRPHASTTDIGSYEGTGYIVNSTADTTDPTDNDSCDVGAGVCTLRAALEEAAFNTGRTDHIEFNIAGAGPHTIAVGTTALPEVSDATIIDASTQSGYTAGTKAVVLDGPNPTSINGIKVTAGDSVIRGFAIGDFLENGILLQTGGRNVVEANHIGVNADGTAAFANSTGLRFENSSNNVIGGTGSGDGNVISGNGIHGITFGSSSGAGNVILGNKIGTNAAGTAAVANTQTGILLGGTSSGTEVGDGTAAGRNVISGNGGAGISITGQGGNVIRGNYIGVQVGGSTALANGGNGISIQPLFGSSGSTVGGLDTGDANVVSGNIGNGIFLTSTGAVGNTVRGNRVGTNAAGTAAVGNGGHGIVLGSNANNNVIGAAGAGNLVAGNAGVGIQVSNAHDTTVQGNIVGLANDGVTPVPNLQDGVFVSGNGNVIGGTGGVTPGGSCTGACNLISANTLRGVFVSGGNDVEIKGNFIGTDVTGLLDKGNGEHGVLTTAVGTNAVIGGSTPSARNIVSGNGLAGIALNDVNSDFVTVQGNYVGVGTNGTTAVPNDDWGVRVGTGHDNLIGGTGPGEGNVIAHNGRDGVQIATHGADGNAILGNSIHDNGLTLFDLGIDIEQAGDASPIDGVTPNDAGDGDTGGNQQQNFPVLAAAGTTLGTLVEGALNSLPSTTYRLEFFSNDACDADGHGEGRMFLGAINVNTDPSGDASFDTTVPTVSEIGDFVTATATNEATGGGTSEFSECVPIVSGVDMVKPNADFQAKKSISLEWAPRDPQGGETFDVHRRSGAHNAAFGGFTDVIVDTTTTTRSFTGSPGRTYCFSARAEETDGDLSPYGDEACMAIPLNDRSFARDRFSLKSGSGYYLGDYVRATKKGAKLVRNGVTASDLALVASKCGSCGKVKVFFAGVQIAHVNLAGSSAKTVLINLPDLPAEQTGQLKIQVTTSGKPVKIGGFGIFRAPPD